MGRTQDDPKAIADVRRLAIKMLLDIEKAEYVTLNKDAVKESPDHQKATDSN